jgi:hypothetical protein
MSIPGDLLTTAMAVMPHKDVDRASEFVQELSMRLREKNGLV